MKKYILGFAAVAMVAVPFSVLATNHDGGNEQPPGQGLEISPPLIELENIDPGTETSFEIRLRNVVNNPLIVSMKVDDFIAAGDDGQPKILLDQAEPTPYSLKSWIVPQSGIRIEPKELKTINVKMTVPENASPGSHFGVVRFTAQAPEDVEGSGVALSASIGSLVLVKINGDIQERMAYDAFFVTQKGDTTHSTFFEVGPLTLHQRLANQGNVHLKPKGTVEIYNTFGRKVAVMPFNENGGNILPNSYRKFSQEWDKKFLFGRYSVVANLMYGAENTVLASPALSFWVIPWKLVLMVLLLLTLLFIGLRSGIKSYNRKIIERAKNGS